eukprot:c38170_g1_i1 orf=3-164(-)
MTGKGSTKLAAWALEKTVCDGMLHDQQKFSLSGISTSTLGIQNEAQERILSSQG